MVNWSVGYTGNYSDKPYSQQNSESLISENKFCHLGSRLSYEKVICFPRSKFR